MINYGHESTATYLVEGDIINQPDGGIVLNPRRSDANLRTFRVPRDPQRLRPLVKHGRVLREPRRQGGRQVEPRNRDSKFSPVGTNERVVALHETDRRAKHARTLVAVRVAGPKRRLLAHDPLAIDLGILSLGVVDMPVTKQQSRGFRTLIFHLDPIDENELADFRIRVRK